MATLLAHQGGWDEVLRVVAPIAVVAVAVMFLNRRMTAGKTHAVGRAVENETAGATTRGK